MALFMSLALRSWEEVTYFLPSSQSHTQEEKGAQTLLYTCALCK